jgi:hypothetical protein
MLEHIPETDLQCMGEKKEKLILLLLGGAIGRKNSFFKNQRDWPSSSLTAVP